MFAGRTDFFESRGIHFLIRVQRREPPMRTSINNIVANVNVFGFGQDRVVVSSLADTCAHAAQHLETRHATSKRARGWAERAKRSWLATAAMAGAARMAELITSLAIYGPQRLPVRHLSPVLVQA